MSQKSSRPDWLKVKLPNNEEYFRLKALVHEQGLNTVCKDAHCPNIGECWGDGTATFMILGKMCTRDCKFCAVQSGIPIEVDLDEPRRVALAVKKLNLKYAVITSVSRDDLADGGARIFAETIRQVRNIGPSIRVEVLIPDFLGSLTAIKSVIEAVPDVLGHNVETVPRLYSEARASADYNRSLDLLLKAKSFGMPIKTKSGIMLGLGESDGEVFDVLRDLRTADVDMLTLGQYLQPSHNHLPIQKYYTPQEFESYRTYAYALGFRYVASGPLVRSSYHAHKAVESAGWTPGR
jgi:lipoic acid synthetase